MYKEKYYLSSNFLDAAKGSNSSFVWHNIHEVRLVVKKCTRWMIRDGSRIHVLAMFGIK